MAIQQLNGVFVPVPPVRSSAAPNAYENADFTMNASGDRMGFVIRVPKTGTLHSFEFRTGTVSNNPDNGLRLSFQDISLTTGNPDGVVDQFCDLTGTISSNSWQTPPGPLTDDGTSGGVKRSVTSGDLLGCVIDFVSFTAGDALQISNIENITNLLRMNIYVSNGATGTYIKETGATPVMSLKYDDGTYASLNGMILPASALGAVAFASNSTPDERGNRLVVGADISCSGAWVHMNGNSTDSELTLYDSSSNILAVNTIDGSQLVTQIGIYEATWASPVTLAADEVYRLALKPTTTTTVSLYSFDVPSAAHMAGAPPGAEWYSTSRTDGGGWSDVSTTRNHMGLILDGTDSSVGAGGPRLINGGLVQ